MMKIIRILASPCRTLRALRIRRIRRKLQRLKLDPLPLSLLIPYLQCFPARRVRFYIPEIAPLISNIEYEKDKRQEPKEGQFQEPYYKVIGKEEGIDYLILNFYHEGKLEYRIKLHQGRGHADVTVCAANDTSRSLQARHQDYHNNRLMLALAKTYFHP